MSGASARKRILKTSVAAAAAGAVLFAPLAPILARRFGSERVVLGILLFGSNIWFIAQTYNINAHYPDGTMLWALGALAAAVIAVTAITITVPSAVAVAAAVLVSLPPPPPPPPPPQIRHRRQAEGKLPPPPPPRFRLVARTLPPRCHRRRQAAVRHHHM